MTTNWKDRQRRRAFLRASLWLVPVACMPAALLVAPFVRWIDDQTRWTLMNLGADGARNVLGALASSLLTFIVFAFSILLLAVQVASGQLTPRIIARLFEDRLTKATIGAFVFAWVYALAAIGRIGDRVPQAPVALAVLLSLFSVGLFLYLVQRATQSMRPVVVLTRLARDTRAVIDAVYPDRCSEDTEARAAVQLDPASARRMIHHSGISGAVLALDVQGVLDIAARAGCTIEIVPQVGDFLAEGDALFRVFGAKADLIDAKDLRDCVAFGPERTLEQDPAFGFRIIVDIASKALSPAINDPTTGVLAIDQLHHLLYVLAHRHLDTGVVRDAAGSVRVLYHTPDWDDFVTLATTEIRLYGGTSPQVTRRLTAMLDHLVHTVPRRRVGVLEKEISLLCRTIERSFPDPEDRVVASRSDLQGFGGAAWSAAGSDATDGSSPKRAKAIMAPPDAAHNRP